MATYLIPLQQDSSDQSLVVELGGTPYVLRFLWNDRYGFYTWFMSLTDGTELISGRAVVTNFPLNSAVGGTALPEGVLVLVREAGNSDYPPLGSLGKEYQLYYADEETSTDLRFTFDSNSLLQEN